MVTLKPTRLQGEVLRGSESSQFLTTLISESETAPAKSNLITISLSASITLFAGTAVTVSGLTSSLSITTQMFAIYFSTNNIMENTQQEGRVVSILQQTLKAYQSVSYSFFLVNPRKKQATASPQFWKQGFPKASLVAESLKWHMGFTRWVGWMDPSYSLGVARSIFAADQVLTFTDVYVTEETNIPEVQNTLDFSITLSSTILAGVTVVLSQLTGSLSAGTAILVTLYHGGNLPITVQGEFVRILGTIKFTVPVAVQSGVVLLVRTKLLNPSTTQISVRPVVSMTLSSAAINLAQEARASQYCCLSASGSYFVESATIRESTDVANEPNVLYLTISMSFPMALGTLVTVTGLVGTQTESALAIILNSDQTSTAAWQKEGSLTFAESDKLYDCQTFSLSQPIPCNSKSTVALSFQLHNPVAAQPALRVQVTATDSAGRKFFEKTDIAGGHDILQARGAGKQFAEISERSLSGQLAVAGAVTVVTVTLRANKALDACHTALFKPGVAVQATWITGQRSLSDCPWRAPASCHGAKNLSDGLRSKGVRISKKEASRPGSGFVQLDLGAVYRIDAFRVTGTQGTSAVSSAQVKHVRLLWAASATAPDAEWHLAGEIVDIPFDSGVIQANRFSAVSAQFLRLEALNNQENLSVRRSRILVYLRTRIDFMYIDLCTNLVKDLHTCVTFF